MIILIILIILVVQQKLVRTVFGYNNILVTARTNASEPKLERMLYYEDTKLRRRRRGMYSTRGEVNKYLARAAKALVTSEPIAGWQNMAEFGR